jgi:exopolysaccharide biosynthesis polyprenyl glycosylphosphotransferase
MKSSKSKISFFKICDISIMLFSLGMSLIILGYTGEDIRSLYDLFQLKFKMINLILLGFFVLIWYQIFCRVGLYQGRWLESGKGEKKSLVQAVLIGSALLLVLAVGFQRANLTWDVVLCFAVLDFALTWAGREGLRLWLTWLWQRNPQRLLLVGSNSRAHNFALHVLSQSRLGYHLIGYVDDPPKGQDYDALSLTLKRFGALREFEAVLDCEVVDEVVICLPVRSYYERIRGMLEVCEQQGIQAHLLSDFFTLRLAHTGTHVRTMDFDGMPLLTWSTRRPSWWLACVKRTIDVIGALSLAMLLSPLFLLIALLIKYLSPDGPIFFVQTRVGYNRRPFRMIKFRSMVPNAEHLQPALEAANEANGAVFKIKDDPRIIPLGHILRKLSLDELPQLFNVIKGDMSLVGPRPLPLRDVQRFEALWLKRRFSMKPGITCLWQVNGRDHQDFDAWVRQDLEYIDHWSLGLDFKILAKTVPAVLRGTGS